MSLEASTPNTANTAAKTKRTISVLSTPEQGGDLKKNRLASGSSADFNYTFKSMDDAEKVDFKPDDKAILEIVKSVEDSFESSLFMNMKSMVESIVAGVLDGLSKCIECLEIDNQSLRHDNKMLRDRVMDLVCAMDASEQYSRRNNVRIFGIPFSPDSKESTDDIIIKLCNTLNVDVSVNEIDRSHRTGKRGGRKPRPIIDKFTSYRARQKLYT